MRELMRRATVIAIAGLASLASVSSPGATQDDARSRPAREDLELRAALGARALTDHDFARSELYTSATREQAERLARDHQLLWATASDGVLRAPYQRSLDALASARATTPRLRSC